MRARSFLSKVLDLSKSSRVVFVLVIHFASFATIVANDIMPVVVKKPVASVITKKPLQNVRPSSQYGKRPVNPAPFKRLPSWPG
jgi:hypothetical protein